MKDYFCLYKKDEPPYTHNLLKLAEEAGLNELLSDDWKKHIDLLMPLNIEARYPDEKREILKRLDAEKAKEIYKKTKELVRWIQNSMKK
jgi:HEPN domain-containing protein